MYRNTIGKCKEIYKRKKEGQKERIKNISKEYGQKGRVDIRTVGKNGRMNKRRKDNCRIGYPKSQT